MSETNKKLQEWIKKTSPKRDKYQQKHHIQGVSQSRPRSSQQSQGQSGKSDSSNEVLKLKQKLHHEQRVNAHFRHQRDQKIDAKQTADEDKGIHDITHGFSERFNKTYHPHYLNENNQDVTYDMHIELRPITLADQDEIASQEEILTNNMGRYFEINSLVLLRAFVTMRVAGVEVPSAFKDPKKLHRVGLLMQVYNDYLRWEDNFRSHQKI